MKKVKNPELVEFFEQIPNVGSRTASDFKVVGIYTPHKLKGKNPYKLYVSLCKKTKCYHDPCTLDVFISAIRFMDIGESLPWWKYTEQRKAEFHKISHLVEKFK